MSTGAFTLSDVDKPAGQFTSADIDKQPGLLDKANEYAGKALAGAGLPTSLSNIPDWFHHLTGQAKDSEPFWEPIKNAIKNPTQENIVNAVPFVGPAAVAMSKDVKQGNYGGAAATLAGTVGAGVLPTKAGEIAGGLNQAGEVLGDTAGAAKDSVANALRDESGKLKPSIQKGATAVGGIAGAAHGIAHGNLESAAIGGYTGSKYLPKVIDALVPDRPAATAPLSEGPAIPELQQSSRTALKQPQPAIQTESQPQVESSTQSSVSSSSPPTPNLPGGPGSFNSPSVPKLTLGTPEDIGIGLGNDHVITNEKGNRIGSAQIEMKPDGVAHVHWLGGDFSDYGRKDVMGAIQEAYPNAEKITYDRRRLAKGDAAATTQPRQMNVAQTPSVNSVADQVVANTTGVKPLQSQVPLRDQGATTPRPTSDTPATTAPQGSETDPLKVKYPDPAQRQMVRANGERIVQAIGNDPDTMKAVHDLTRVDLRQAAINHGFDMGQTTVSNSKFAGEGSITREAMFNKLLDAGLKPSDIVRLAKQGQEQISK